MPGTLRTSLRPALALLTTLSMALALAVTGSVLTAPRADAATKVRHAVSVARNQVGDRYHYGSDGPRRFADQLGRALRAQEVRGVELARGGRAAGAALQVGGVV